ncbi:hypothetical protein SBADM41S_10572 [Streptomyces badius]
MLERSWAWLPLYSTEGGPAAAWVARAVSPPALLEVAEVQGDAAVEHAAAGASLAV